jgi:hypothetical protein
MPKDSVEDMINTPSEYIMHDADDLLIGPKDMTKQHLEGIIYAARFMRHRGGVHEAEELLTECGINTVPQYDLENSEFIRRVEAEGMKAHVQGFMRAGKGKDAIRYPIIMVNGDIMRWEIFMQKLKSDLKEELKNDSN